MRIIGHRKCFFFILLFLSIDLYERVFSILKIIMKKKNSVWLILHNVRYIVVP